MDEDADDLIQKFKIAKKKYLEASYFHVYAKNEIDMKYIGKWIFMTNHGEISQYFDTEEEALDAYSHLDVTPALRYITQSRSTCTVMPDVVCKRSDTTDLLLLQSTTIDLDGSKSSRKQYTLFQ